MRSAAPRVAAYAEKIAATLERAGEALRRLEAAPDDRGARERAIRELGRISGYIETSSAPWSITLTGASSQALKGGSSSFGREELHRSVVAGRKPIPSIDRLASGGGLFPGARRRPANLKGAIEQAMEKFTTLTGVAAPLPMRNVDTDMIIPKQFLKTIKRTGLGKSLFYEMRFDAAGQREARFRAQQAGLPQGADPRDGRELRLRLSREHAPWALLDFGIRCVIAPCFADIFYNNCFQNGILPIKLPQSDVDKLMDDASRGANATITVDLEKQEIRGPDGGVIKFDIDPFRKHCLLNGLDNIGLTLEKQKAIDASRKRSREPRGPGSERLP